MERLSRQGTGKPQGHKKITHQWWVVEPREVAQNPPSLLPKQPVVRRFPTFEAINKVHGDSSSYRPNTAMSLSEDIRPNGISPRICLRQYQIPPKMSIHPSIPTLKYPLVSSVPSIQTISLQHKNSQNKNRTLSRTNFSKYVIQDRLGTISAKSEKASLKRTHRMRGGQTYKREVVTSEKTAPNPQGRRNHSQLHS